MRKRIEALILFAMLFSGCAGRAKPQSLSSPNAVVVAVFDVSGSTSSVRNRYLDDFQKQILGQVKGGEQIYFYTATEDTMATASPAGEYFPLFDENSDDPNLSNTLAYKGYISGLADSLSKKAMEECKTSSPGSDLMDAYDLASKLFAGEKAKGAPHKILIVFSDMIEQARDLDFTSTKLTEKEIGSIILRKKKEGMLPNLQGVKVWVAGATASEGKGLSPEKIHRIQEFWVRYFHACGATLSRDHYATRLLDFSLP